MTNRSPELRAGAAAPCSHAFRHPRPPRARYGRVPSVIALVACLVGSSAGAPALVAQRRGPPPRPERPEPPPSDTAWTIAPNAAADLWFHGLALAGIGGSGPLPVYSAEYAARIRQAKDSLALAPTPLDTLVPWLERAFARDSALLIFHFVPLYFRTTDPDRMLAALAAVAARRTNDSALVGRDVRRGAAVVTAVLERRDQRRLLGAYVDALRREWELFYGAYWDAYRRAAEERVAAAAAFWSGGMAEPLGDMLRRLRLLGGVAWLSPPVGPEGRLDPVDPIDPGDNVVVVAFPPDGRPRDAIFGMVKEFCYALIDRAVDPSGLEPAEVEALRARLAVRCGALVIDFYAPTQAAAYRRTFLRAAGQSPDVATAAAFERAYPLTREQFETLRGAVRGR